MVLILKGFHIMKIASLRESEFNLAYEGLFAYGAYVNKSNVDEIISVRLAIDSFLNDFAYGSGVLTKI